MRTRDAIRLVRSQLTDDLRNKKYRKSINKYTGHCYLASEVLYYYLGGNWKPMFIRHEGEPHWFLKNSSGKIIDATFDQFTTPVCYNKAKGKGFLTNKPSKRARILMYRIGTKK